MRSTDRCVTDCIVETHKSPWQHRCSHGQKQDKQHLKLLLVRAVISVEFISRFCPKVSEGNIDLLYPERMEQQQEQQQQGSAFPDVCCSFDLLLQLKHHPAPSPPPCTLAATETRVQDDSHTLLAAYAPTRSSSPHHHHPLLAAGPHPQLSLNNGPAPQPLSTS
ncbi:unnamed protein product [Pleuronectes platessa]|uniref:Uncharacterized protein n=1 Tax=Pleuronectes platessa TaxID=8262 RepID=A0A9N7UK08_PLEPL|nr:unnamed protein product [Pleuronectes platessa]